MDFHPIAHFQSPFPSKFGIPRQSGLVEDLRGSIIFTPEYRNPIAIRGLEDFDYIWILWEFAEKGEHLTVRPPLLGGNKSVGVFASRSPFRPNPIGLSSVRIENIEWETSQGPVIHTLGADLMDGTPIIDIKPYLTYADCHPEAKCGFVDRTNWHSLEVSLPENIDKFLSLDEQKALIGILKLDPRPPYQKEEDRIYGMQFLEYNILFKVLNNNKLQVLLLEEL